MNPHSSNAVPVVFQVLIFGIFVILAIWSAVRKSRMAQKRSKELWALSQQLGLAFQQNRDEGFAVGWSFLTKVAQGTNRYAFNILRGNLAGNNVLVFDYHFQTGSGKSRKLHDCTFLMLIVQEAFPPVTIEPETFSSIVAEALGFGDIKFESAEFSRLYRVRSEDKKFAYDVCNPQMIDYLLENKGLVIEVNGPVILLAFENQLSASAINFNLNRLLEIRARLPDYLFTKA